MANQRHDLGGRPKTGRYGLTAVSYPTPNVEDLVIVEDVTIEEANYAVLLPGTPHPKKATALLVKEEAFPGDNTGKRVRRTYATPRAAQTAYNRACNFAAGEIPYPIHIRTTIEPRKTYTPPGTQPSLLPLTALTAVQVTAGGSGYTSAPTVVFTGGAGSGATATAQMQRGAVVAIMLTDGGSGFTSAPAVSFTGGGGSGATATAEIQNAALVCVDEDSAPAEGEFAALFLKVTRTYARTMAVTTHKLTSEFGGGAVTTTKTVGLTSGLGTPVGGLTITEHEVVETQPGWGIETKTQLDLSSWPILYGTNVDSTTGIVVNFRKQVVAAGTAGGISGAEYTEVQPLDKWRSIAITSTVDETTLPAPVSYKTTVDIQRPDSYVNTRRAVSSGHVIDIAYTTARYPGATGPSLATVTVYYLSVAQLAAMSFGTLRTMLAGRTQDVSEVFATIGAEWCRVFSFAIPLNDSVTGNVVSVRVSQLNFGIFQVVKITV